MKITGTGRIGENLHQGCVLTSVRKIFDVSYAAGMGRWAVRLWVEWDSPRVPEPSGGRWTALADAPLQHCMEVRDRATRLSSVSLGRSMPGCWRDGFICWLNLRFRRSKVGSYWLWNTWPALCPQQRSLSISGSCWQMWEEWSRRLTDRSVQHQQICGHFIGLFWWRKSRVESWSFRFTDRSTFIPSPMVTSSGYFLK